MLGVEAFEALIGVPEQARQQPLPVQQLRREFQQALAEAGINTPDAVIGLARDVKRELADERNTAR